MKVSTLKKDPPPASTSDQTAGTVLAMDHPVENGGNGKAAGVGIKFLTEESYNLIFEILQAGVRLDTDENGNPILVYGADSTVVVPTERTMDELYNEYIDQVGNPENKKDFKSFLEKKHYCNIDSIFDDWWKARKTLRNGGGDRQAAARYANPNGAAGKVARVNPTPSYDADAGVLVSTTGANDGIIVNDKHPTCGDNWFGALAAGQGNKLNVIFNNISGEGATVNCSNIEGTASVLAIEEAAYQGGFAGAMAGVAERAKRQR